MGAHSSKANFELPLYAQEVDNIQTSEITKCTNPKLKKQLSIELKVDLVSEEDEISTEWDIIRADYKGNSNLTAGHLTAGDSPLGH